MKVKLTYKQKNKLLIAVIILFTWVAWSVSFKETVSLYNECTDMEDRLRLAADAPQKIKEIELKLAEIKHFSDQNADTELSTQQQILNTLTAYCRTTGTVLKEFPQTSVKEQNGLTIETNVFVTEGNFINLLKLIYLLEQKEHIGQTASVEFISKKDFKTQRIGLTAKVYLQNIINNDQPNKE